MLNVWTRASSNANENSKQEFEACMRQSYKQVFALALRLTGQASDAEDLMQEAYVRAFRFFYRYDRSLPFTSWMYRIVTNVHIDSRRKIKIKSFSLDSTGADGETSWEVADERLSPDREINENLLDEHLQLGLLAMSAEFRTAVVLADVEGMAYEEIAELMNTSIGTVRSRIHRGRNQLRKYLVAANPDKYREEVTV